MAKAKQVKAPSISSADGEAQVSIAGCMKRKVNSCLQREHIKLGNKLKTRK